MIVNRPKYLEDIPFYKALPDNIDIGIDFTGLPPLFNLDLHQLNGLQPLVKSRFDFIKRNGEFDDHEATITFVNPLPEELEYYRQKGTTSFQMINIVLNLCNYKQTESSTLTGMPYSVSILPASKRGQIDPWDIEFIKLFDLEKDFQGGDIFSDFDPFNGWYSGFYGSYSALSGTLKNYTDTIGFIWGSYLLCESFDNKEVIMLEDRTAPSSLKSKFKKYRTKLYFEPFKDIKPRKIWGLDSPIELFLLHGLLKNNLKPDIQTLIFRNGQVFPNYHDMVRDQKWITEDKLITSADFYFPNQKVAIFCDGKEFHSTTDQIARDNKINDSLADIGIKTLRFTGDQINNDLENVIDSVEKILT